MVRELVLTFCSGRLCGMRVTMHGVGTRAVAGLRLHLHNVRLYGLLFLGDEGACSLSGLRFLLDGMKGSFKVGACEGYGWGSAVW